jgi:hypothetical protein
MLINLGKKANLGWAALVVVAAVEIMYCVDYHEHRWNRLTHTSASSEPVGEGLVIQWNGLGYYAWLRSLIVDGDLDFDNEFDEHNPLHYYVPPSQYRTPTGRRANQWSVGPACIWGLAVVPGHLFLKMAGPRIAPWAPDGYSLPYQVCVCATSVIVHLIGLGFLYGICLALARPTRAALAAACITLGTTILYYSAIEVSLPHGIGTAIMAGYVWYWLTTYGSMRPGRWFLVGVLAGAAALMRWQLATYAILPAAELVLTRPLRIRARSLLAASAAFGAVIAFCPQMIAWKCVYGSWLVRPIQGVSYHWLTPALWTILGSQDRSFFYWTPLTLIACAGTAVFMFLRRPSIRACFDQAAARRWEPSWILGMAFLVQVYALAGMWGQGPLSPTTGNFEGIFLARSYGMRDLTESVIVLAPGLAWLLEMARPRSLRVLGVLCLWLCAWNLILVDLYSRDAVPAMAGADPMLLLRKSAELVRLDPLSVVQAFAGPTFIGIIVFFCPDSSQ